MNIKARWLMVLWVGVLVSHEVNATFIEQAAAPKIASQWVGKLADLCEVAQDVYKRQTLH